MTDKTISVEIHYVDETERAKARKVLEDVGGKSITNYDGFISSLVEHSALENVANCGLFAILGDDVDATPSAVLASEEGQVGKYFPESVLKGQMVELVDSFRSLSAHVKLVPADHDEEIPLCEEGSGDICTKSVHTLEKLEYLSEPRVESDPRLDGFNYERLGSSTRTLPELDELLPNDAYLVRLAGALTAQRRDTLANLNVELKNRRPLDTYTALLNSDQLSNLEVLDFVRAVKRYDLADTLSTEFQESLAAANKTTDGKVTFQNQEPQTFEITLHSESYLYKVASLVQASTGEKILGVSGCHFWFTARLDSPVLSVLANFPEVAQISPYEVPILFCDCVRKLVGVEKVSSQESPPSSLDGDGEVVGVLDTGVDQYNPDFISQNLDAYGFFNGEDYDGHGTHVAGIIAGTGASSGRKFRGMAPGAKLISVGICTKEGKVDIAPYEVEVELKKLHYKGVRIFNLSWGDSTRGYDAHAWVVDEFVRQNPDALVVIAAGNWGKAPDGYHKLGTLGSPANAKNAITVGASSTDRIDETRWGTRYPDKFPYPPASEETVGGNADSIAPFSSRGPTFYGRIKPDLLAPGTGIVAPLASQSYFDPLDFEDPDFKGPNFKDLDFKAYTKQCGTSMSSPAVAGAAALLRQHLRVKWGVNPSAALLKALLIASCKRVPEVKHSQEGDSKAGFPDFDQGHGRVDLRNIIPHEGTPENYRTVGVDVANGSEDGLTSGEPYGSVGKTTHLYKIKTPVTVTSRLKIVLAFTDLPGDYPQNNLNLLVSESSGSGWAGNNGHHFGDTTDCTEPTNHDCKNTIEQVCVHKPKPDTVYTIKVTAQSTIVSEQGYALAVCGQMQEHNLKEL